MAALTISKPLELPYRGDGTDRPTHIPLPPNPMPLFYGGRLLKRWRYISIWSADLSLCAATVFVGPVPQEFWAIWDRQGRRLWEHTRLWAGRVQLPTGKVLVRDGGISIDITLDESDAFEVVTPVGDAYTWTRKQCGIRAHGTVQVNCSLYPVEAVALIDENAGYHPRHTHWRWSGGAGTDVRGRKVAWSVIVGLNDSPINSERTIWVDGVPHEVEPVVFADDLSRVTFADGSQLHFTEESVRQRRDNLLLIRSSYRQPFGAFSGMLPGGIQLREAYGVMEDHAAVW
ncbi:MAG: DUF2804 family protein [Chloroflexi bacterium]|nr:DUF2804 family protein [Chloroflexota bacterium]